MHIEIKKIILLIGHGPDRLIMETNLPNGCFPFTDKASAMITVAAEEGEAYCRKNFTGVEIEVVRI